AQIFPFFTGNGTINLSSGTITLSGGGQNLGTVNFTSASNKIIVDNTTLTINTSPAITGNGYLTINGGSGRLQLLAPLTLENIELLQGQIDSGNLTVNTTLVWKSGTMLGPGTTTLFTATLDHSAPTGTTLLDGRTLTLDGSTFNYAANGFGLTLRNGSTINNNSGSLFDSLDAGNVLSGGTGPNTISNATGATLRKSGGTGGTRLDVVVANAGGTIASQVSGQSLIINGGGTMTSGTLTTNAGALLDIFGGTFTHTGGLITGSGAVRILGSGTLQFNASAVASTTIQLETGGTLDVANTFILAVDNVNWLGGTVQGGGQTRTLAGVISNIAPTTLASGHLFETLGTFDYSADTTNYLTNSGTFLVGNAGGILRFTTNGRFAGSGTLRNRNIIRKTGGTGVSIVDSSLDSNTDSIELATAGTIRFTGGGTITDTVLDTGSGTFDFSAGTMSVNGTSTISGTGTIQISGATVNFDSAVTAPNLQFTAGALGGSGAFHIGGGKWVGGDMNATGTTFVNSGASFELSTATPKKLRRNFVNNGTVFTQNLPASMTFENGATMTNNNLVELGENTNFFCNCTPTATFVNAAGATLHQFNAAGTSNYLTKFDNAGTVDLDTGILFLLNGGTHTGAFTPGPNTYMAFNGGTHTMSAATSITGGGAVGFNATSSTFDGTLSISGPTALLVVDGGATFNSATTISTTAMEIRSGTVGGSANIDVTGNLFPSSWLNGTITGTGAFTIGPGTPFDFSATTGSIILDGRTITNNGTITYTTASNPLALTNNASIQNAGTFSVQTDTAINAGIGANTIINSGTFKKITATGNTLISAATTNTNIANFSTGMTTFNGGYTQNAGTTTIASGATLASPLTINLNGGTLTGTGIVAADLNNDGTVAPGMSPGLLQINGDYAQSASGILNIEIAGVNPGVTYDQLGVSGTATLNGTLNASYIGGFVPTDGNTFDVLTFASSTGTFSTENLPSFASGGTTTSSYLPSSYRLTAVVTQADLAIAQTSSGTTLHGQNATFTVTVTNNGPDSTGGVSVTDSYSGGTLVSATSTIGSCVTTTPIVCTIGTLTSGQSATITIVINGATVGTITNSASVTGTEFDPNNGNNATGTSSVNVVAAADLDVAINESADPVSAGASMNYVVTIVNFGPDNAASFSLALSMTNGSIVSTSSASLSCSGSGASATCSAASLNVGTHSVTVNVTAPLSSNFVSLTATGSSATADPSSANNSQTEFTSVDTLADLSITKTGPATLTAGGSVTYTIKVKNIGPATATNVIVSDPTPNRLSFDSNSGDCATAFPCNLGTLSVNQTKTIFATYDVNAGTEG
ncbi:MAG TPA: DUF11 domain-containing protein, partial [Thermoanaerobaculia bacterium]